MYLNFQNKFPYKNTWTNEGEGVAQMNLKTGRAKFAQNILKYCLFNSS